MDTPALPTASSIWMRGYLPNGRMLSITALPTDDFAAIIQRAIALDAAMVAAGLSVREPGLNEGEQRETIHYVARRSKVNDDDSETPMLDMYAENHNWATLKEYLNTAAEVQAFERVAGIQLTDIPYNPNHKDAPNRNDRADQKYIFTLPRPVNVIYKQNPKWQGEGDKKNRKFLFVRWADAPTTPPAAQNGANPPILQENGHSTDNGELRIVEKPATPKNGSYHDTPDAKLNAALIGLRTKVRHLYGISITETQIAKWAEIKDFADIEAWRTKYGSLDNALDAIKAAYEFDQLPSMVQQVDF